MSFLNLKLVIDPLSNAINESFKKFIYFLEILQYSDPLVSILVFNGTDNSEAITSLKCYTKWCDKTVNFGVHTVCIYFLFPSPS